MEVFSADGSNRVQLTADSNGNHYHVTTQTGNRWLDDHRLIFWDPDRERAFLWDVDEEHATVIDDLNEPAEFVFSEDGRTLFTLSSEIETEIWMLELSK